MTCPLPPHSGHEPPGLDKALAVAIRAGIAPSDVQPHDPAPDGSPEGNVDLILEVGPRLGTFLRPHRRVRRKFRKKCRGSCRCPTGLALPASGIFEHIGKVEAAEIEVRGLPAATPGCRLETPNPPGPARAAAGPSVGISRRGIDVVGVKPDLIVNLALLGIAQDIVGFGQRLELLFRNLVAGIDVGMILARELAKGLANIVRRGRLLHAENFVVVLLVVVAILAYASCFGFADTRTS